MNNNNNNTTPVTNRQPLLSTVRTQDGSTLPFSVDIDVTSDIDVTGENIDGTEDNIDILETTLMGQQTLMSHHTYWLVPKQERLPQRRCERL
jgi:hypothetical protein